LFFAVSLAGFSTLRRKNMRIGEYPLAPEFRAAAAT
jgi:hypothetical protein